MRGPIRHGFLARAGAALAPVLAGACGASQNEPAPPPPAALRIEAPPPAAAAAHSSPRVAAAARNLDFDVAALLERPPEAQSYTPPVTSRKLPAPTRMWRTQVGKTTFRTTIAMVGGEVLIGTHGASLGGKGERTDGVYVLDATKGAVKSVIRPPGGGDLDVGGIAVDGDRVYFGTDSGLVVAATKKGKVLWTSQAKGKVRPAPALGHFDADGVRDVVVGDEGGFLRVLSGATGAELWHAVTATNEYGARGFIGGAAVADLTGDGQDDIVAGARDGVLAAYRGVDGDVLWQVREGSGIHASPSIGDFDGDGLPEVLAAWSYGEVAILDGKSGAKRWSIALARDDGGIEGLFGSPVPLEGSPGVLVTPTAWWTDVDGVVLVGPAARAFKAFEGRVSSTAVVADLDGDGEREAIVGTEKGTVVALTPGGGRAELVTLGGPVEAPALLADLDGDGALELLVASNDGYLTCFHTGSRAVPDLARFRGDDPGNRGGLGRVSLGWQVALQVAPASPSPGIRLDYLECCSALARAATRAPSPENAALLQASAACMTAASRRAERTAALDAVRAALPASAVLPDACR